MTTIPAGDALNVWEQAARAFELRAPNPVVEAADADSWSTPGTLAKRITRNTRQTPALDLIDQALIDLMDTPDGRLIITLPPQEGKSTRVAKDFIIWVLKHRPWTRIIGASYGQGLANRNGRTIRNTITGNPDLGLAIASDNGSASEWQLAGHDGGLVSVGIGAGLTGRPADLEVIDDPIKDRKEADSEIYRQSVWDWWTDVASTRLAPGAQVVLILTRWHQDDLAGRLLKAEDGHLWRVLNIPAIADHDPAQGQSDPLGRDPGEYLESARNRTPEQWDAIRTRVGARTWNALYQGRPSPAEGGIFRRDAWARYAVPLWVDQDNGSRIVPGDGYLIQSWDMAFKDTKGSDYVVGQVWLQRDAGCYLLDQVRGRWSFTDTCAQLRQLSARWPQATAKFVEDKANGTAVIDALHRTVPGLIPVEPEGGKYARAQAVAPLVEARNVWLPDPEVAPWVGDLVEEAAGFPNGTHDDQVDALTQGLARLLVTINSRVADTVYSLD